jgi:uncharacterized glyoxalase superfamily protein PhnB
MSSDKDAATEGNVAEGLSLKSISPSLTVDDIVESIRWYTEVVGFTLKDRWEHEGKLMGAEITSGDAHLMITQDDWAKGRDRPKGEGFRLFLSASRSVDDIAADIRSRGGELASEPQDVPWGGRAFSLVDPSGYKITIASD